MIKTQCLRAGAREFTGDFAPAQISDYCEVEDNIVWVDMNAPTEEDFAILAEEFNFHPLAIEDCRNAHQRPKIEEYTGYYFLVLYEAEISEDGRKLVLRELNIFLGKNYLVTVHSSPLKAIEVAERLWPEWSDKAEHGAALLAYLLLDAVVDDYMPLLDSVSERLDDLEDMIFEEFQPEAIEEIFRVKKQLLHLRRCLTPLRDVFNTMLRREQPIFPRETYFYFQDVFDHVIRVADTVDTLRDMVSSAMDAYLSVSGNRMNMVMKRMTAISTILMSVTLIAGIYGMNFEFMPELKWKFGYVFALLSMVGVGFALYVYLRKIKWL
jgi:magnesium transporter